MSGVAGERFAGEGALGQVVQPAADAARGVGRARLICVALSIAARIRDYSALRGLLSRPRTILPDRISQRLFRAELLQAHNRCDVRGRLASGGAFWVWRGWLGRHGQLGGWFRRDRCLRCSL